MQRSLTATDVNFVSLQSAVFCVQCELLSENNTMRCLACGSRALLSLSRVLGGSLGGQQTAHLIADAELDRLVRSLLSSASGSGSPAEARDSQEECQVGENAIMPAAATNFSTRHRMRPRHHGPISASHPLINAAAMVVAEGIAPAEIVDGLLEGCLGHSTGPLRTADLIGLDNLVDSLNVLYERTGEDTCRPCGLLLEKVRAGDLGRKSGQGFYDYGKVAS